MKQSDFCMMVQIYKNLKLFLRILGGHGHLVRETLKSAVP